MVALVAVAVAGSLPCATAHAANGIPCGYTFVPITGAPVDPVFGPANVYTHDINDLGVICGEYWFGAGYSKGFIWSEERGFQAIAAPAGYFDVSVDHINNAGVMCVSATSTSIEDVALVFDPATGIWTPIQSVSSIGWAGWGDLNELGEVAGWQSIGSRQAPNYPYGGFRWSAADGKVDIMVPPGPATWCTDINDKGVIVGYSGSAGLSPDTRAFFVDGGRVTILPPIPDGFRSNGLGTNNAGTVVGYGAIAAQGFPNGKQRGFVWSEGVMIRVDPDPLHHYSAVLDINDSGLALGLSWNSTVTPAVGDYSFFWMNGVRTDVEELPIDPANLSNPGASAINSKGELAGGAYLTIDGQLQSFGGVFRPTGPPGDLNCDGAVNGLDLAALLELWGKPGGLADTDGNGQVDGADLGTLLGNWTG